LTEEESWSYRFPQCGGSSQSPIDIIPRGVVDDHLMTLSFLPSYKGRISEMFLTNDGFTLDCHFVRGERRPAVIVSSRTPSGEARPILTEEVYLFDRMHFHWGSKNSIGSEHAILGQKFPLEMHLVHFNDKYGSLTEARDRRDGLLVVAVFFQVNIRISVHVIIKPFALHIGLFSSLCECLSWENSDGDHLRQREGK
jgi:carbonic anhydrase